MFRRRIDGIDCRFGGDHAVSTPRLRVAVARWTEHLGSQHLCRDAEAQYWLGWDPAQVLRELPVVHNNPLLLDAEGARLVGIENNSGRIIASIVLTRRSEGSYEVGGMVDPLARGQGFGREALGAVCRLAHEHFGIRRLVAGCETTNVASRRWLTSCGFSPSDGPGSHTLPNGRIIESLHWQRFDSTAKRRCRRFTFT